MPPDPMLALQGLRASRRRLLQGCGAVAASWLLPGVALRDSLAQIRFADDPFRLGVAAGEPAADGFVIWTRLNPRPLDIEAAYGMPRRPVEVLWEVAADEGFQQIAASGRAIAHPELGHSVHVEVGGLASARPYWYRFSAGGARSPAGRARTLAAPGSLPAWVRFGVAGCQHYEQGLYTAHQHLAAEELDFVYCYGDYIYEGAGRDSQRVGNSHRPTVRRMTGGEVYTLDEYRRRYAEYKLDPLLQRSHANHAWFCSWDDHEIDNNWAGEHDQDGTPPALFALRKAMAAQAYFEMMPLRPSRFPAGGRLQLNRRARCGDLLELHFLDTRSQRSDQACSGEPGPEPCAAVADPKATMLGEAQERWLMEGIGASRTRWQGLAQQVMLSDFLRDAKTGRINLDAWAGYQVPRERLLSFLHERRVPNWVVLTGDEHKNFALDLKLHGGASEGPVLGSEFVVSSISSGGDGSPLGPGGHAVLDRNPHCKLYNAQRGYAVCEVGPQRWETSFRVLDQVSKPGGQLRTLARFAIEAGRPGLQPV